MFFKLDNNTFINMDNVESITDTEFRDNKTEITMISRHRFYSPYPKEYILMHTRMEVK